jgi:hypothetical protein
MPRNLQQPDRRKTEANIAVFFSIALSGDEHDMLVRPSNPADRLFRDHRTNDAAADSLHGDAEAIVVRIILIRGCNCGSAFTERSKASNQVLNY